MTSTLQALRLVYGIRPPDGDTSADFIQQDVIELLNLTNFSVNGEGWIPKVASLKQGGLYLDSGVGDGQELVSAAYDNVKESFILTSTGATLQSRYEMESRLHKMNARAIAYHTETEAWEPVYLEWRAAGAPAAQYALVYSIEIAYSANTFQAVNLDEIAVVITREPMWRGIPPRVPAQAYTLEKAGSELTSSNVELVKYTGNVFDGTVNNKMEITAGAAYLTKNFIKIPAASIPGDAPALVTIAFGADVGDANYPNSSNRVSQLYISKTTKLRDLEMNSATFARLPRLCLNAGHGQPITGAFVTPTAQYGPIIAGLGVRNWEYVVASSSYAADPDLEITMQITPSMYGRYAIFLRSHFTSAGSGQYVMGKLEVGNNAYNGADQLNMLSAKRFVAENRIGQLQGVQNRMDLTYMGTIQLPFAGKDSFDGNARHNLATGGYAQDYVFKLSVKNVGVSRTIRVADLVLMPIDEGMVAVEYAPNPIAVLDVGADVIVYDNTSHLNAYGYPQAISARANAGSTTQIGAVAPVLKGDSLTLTPGVDNYLVFLWTEDPNGQAEAYQPNFNVVEPVSVNIVPRWMGVRDVL